MKVFSSIKKMISIETPKKKAGRISICILISALIFIAFPAWSADYYIAQSAAGSRGGSSCANAKAITWDWTSPNVIGDDTVHLCGTITSNLAIAKSGTSGHPITVKFETGAKFSATVWGAGGAIYCTGQQYIIIDGGTNGIIENTANGDLLANQSLSRGVYSTCSNMEIKNLTIQNLYIHVYGSNKSAVDTGGIALAGGSDISVHHNIISNSASAVTHVNTSGGTLSNISFYNNTVTRCNWGIQPVVGGAGTITNNVNMYNNDITIGSNWVGSDGSQYHLNGMYAFSSGGGAQLNNLHIYNNYIHGESVPDGLWSASGFIHFDYAYATGTKIYNNLLVGASSNPSPAYIDLQDLNDAAPEIYNNTIIGYLPSEIGGRGILHDCTAINCGTIVKNNIFHSTVGVHLYATTGYTNTPVADNNTYYNIQGWVAASGGGATVSTTLADWQNALGGCPGLGKECNSITSNPNLNASYTPKDTSPVGGKGVNLTSLRITALNGDKSGVARPSSGAWDMGAYAYGYNKPKPPRNLRINAQ